MIEINLNDIKRGLAEGGDLSVFSDLYLRGLGNLPVKGNPSTDQATSLPDPWVILRYFDPALAAFMTSEHGPGETGAGFADDGLTLVGLAPYGRNVSRYLEGVFNAVRPDIVAVDARPYNFSASMLYAFNLFCAAGLPAQAEITYAKNGQLYDSRHFLPGSLDETALILSWNSKIPLFPAGPYGKPLQPEIYSQHGYLYDAYFWARWQSGLTAAYQELDAGLQGNPSLADAGRMADEISGKLMNGIGDEIDHTLRESLRAESCYIASRLLDAACFNRQRGQKVRLLALVDITHYADLRQYWNLFQTKGGLDSYLPPEVDNQVSKMLYTGRKRTTSDREKEADITPDSPAQKLFRRQFEAYIEEKDHETISETDIHRMVTEIAARLRSHPNIAQGVSVRGTIALEEVLDGFAQVSRALNRKALIKAALLTLPPRLVLKLKGDASALVADIAKEVVYGFQYSAGGYSLTSSARQDRLSTEAILNSLEKLGPLPAKQKTGIDRSGLPAVLSESEKKMFKLKYLESLDLIKKDQKGRYSLTGKALQQMLKELERQFNAGEISQDEYNTQKARFSTLLNNLADPHYQNQLSDQEKASTIMEMMDAQDRGWNSGVNFNLMHLYYHVKQTSEGVELSPQKREYYALGRLIDEFARQQMLKKSNNTKEPSFVLTGIALEMLFKYLMNGKNDRLGLTGLKGEGKDTSGERKQETRRYSSGDAFRDISIRHTLKTLAKQQKGLNDIRKKDLRVYLKQPRRPQSDIVVCVDTSGSMGFHHELVYARLVAAGLVQAAIKERDRVGLVAFNDYGQISVPLTEKDGTSLIDCIAGLSIRGNTNIGDGLKCASEMLFRDRTSNQKYIVLVTDGQPTALSEKVFARLKTLKGKDLTEESALLEARQAAAKGAVISVVHIAGKGQDGNAFIRNIARIGKGTVRRLSGANDLRVVLH